MMARQTAKKVRATDIVNGSFVKKEGFEPSFVTTKRGEEVSRARVLGTVVDTFKSEDGNFASITVDDGSSTIRLKAFKETEVVDNLKVGDIVDFVGKVKEYNGEIYMIAEVAKVVDDPNFELLRRLELLKKEKAMPSVPVPSQPKPAPAPVQSEPAPQPTPAAPAPAEQPVQETPELVKASQIQQAQSPPESPRETNDTTNSEVKLSDRGELKKHILQIIGENQDGIVYSEIAGKVKAKETDIESVIDELLNEGICYEPSPGKIRKI
ncbi:MAG: hypothetical protein KAS04_01715 [Candidatus Aenigmarchaeota archaeon]|nr:hypothetical protein [Candidatus Aenigmarchaeota archaeon]